jgi:hypothetical protein
MAAEAPLSTTIFSRQLRLLLCPQCGAPIEGGIGGGGTSCRYCHASVFLQPRDESRDLAGARAQPVMSEAERFQRLRAQDHQPLVPPSSIQPLMVGGRLPAQNLGMAFGELQRARQEVAAGGSFGAAERLFFLAMMIYGALAEQAKDAEIRAVLETARDLLPDPRHRQVIHGMLARNAARTGDFAAAEEWLGLCNARSPDLVMDTAFRFTRAYISTMRGDFATVLAVLGNRVDDVPIADGQDEVCGMLRANALERVGQLPSAVEQLVQLGAGTPDRGPRLRAVAAANMSLGLCPQSLVVAEQQIQSMHQNAVRTKSGVNIGAMVGGIIGCVVGVLVLDAIAWAVVPSEAIAIVHTVLILGSIGGSFALVFVGIARMNAAKQRLLATGAPGRAQVLEVRGTGVRVNGQPMVELVMQVQLPGRPPYVAIHKELMGANMRGRAMPNANVAVRVDPADPANMAVDWASP